ncbi:MAG TPA: ROK family protein [Verrucomicrobiota bacterium]|nr:ROK family protein [Verrucomicrobiota bacterium]
MLNLVRKHQPVSRADLTRYSGLQRSTVSAITEKLIADRWLKEGAVGNLPRGRKPTFLHLNSERAGIVGVDVQSAVTTLAVADMSSRFLAQESIQTPQNPNDFVARLSSRILDLMRAHPKSSYEGVGISLPGRVDSASQRLIFAPSLGWTDFDLKTPLESALEVPVELENAANSCALAELWSGRHEGAGNLVAVTVSDGIGVGMVMNGQLVRGSSGVAGEFGHVTQSQDGPECRCGNIGCWEVFASNAAAVRYYAESSSVRKGEIGSKSNMASVPFGDILRLVDQGDVKATLALNKMAKHLGDGLAMLITGLAPDVLVIVGDVTRAWERVGPIVSESIKRRSLTNAVTRIIPTDPEAQPRLRGTVAMVLQKHFGAPVIA